MTPALINKPTRPVLRWHGGKWRLAPWIISHFPEHDVYVEPFGGGASVLMRKQRSKLEIYNDLDLGAVRFFRVLRDDADALCRAVAATPFSRAVFESAYSDTADDLLHALNFLSKSHMGFGSNSIHKKSGFRAAGRRAGALPVHGWSDMPWVVREAADRLRGVVIESKPAVDVMLEHDEVAAVHYVDPPYVAATRDPGTDYAHEMSDADHADLLECLKHLSGHVVLSGYPSEVYDNTLQGWHRVEKKALADGARERTEVLWMNFTPTEETQWALI